MTRSLEDPTFAGRVESVAADLSYRVEFGGRSTRDVPRHASSSTPSSMRTDAKLVFPGYTSLEPKTVEDIRHVTAVEGTELTLLCRLNKEVASASWSTRRGRRSRSRRRPDDAPVYSAKLTLADSHRYKVQLVDRDGRTNKLAAELGVNVTRNRPPTIAMTQPGARRAGLAGGGAPPQGPGSTTTSASSATA